MSTQWDVLIRDVRGFAEELDALKKRDPLTGEPWASILAERKRTAEAHGDRGLQELNPVHSLWLPVLIEEVGEIGQLFCSLPGPFADDGFLKALRKEAVQVAAIATAWIDAIDAKKEAAS